MGNDRLLINAATLIVAGSETTATLLSGVTYLLLRNPDAMKKATEEVRAAFGSEEDITLTSVSKLTYMLACLNEALRCYPPVAFGMPRIVPKGRGGVTITGQVVPDKVGFRQDEKGLALTWRAVDRRQCLAVGDVPQRGELHRPVRLSSGTVSAGP